MLGHFTPDFASIDITFANSKPGPHMGLKLLSKAKPAYCRLHFLRLLRYMTLPLLLVRLPLTFMYLTCNITSKFIFEHHTILTFVTSNLITLTNPRCRLCNSVVVPG